MVAKVLEINGLDELPENFLNEKLITLESFRLFSRILPKWSKDFGASAVFNMKITPRSEGVIFDIGFSEGTLPEVIVELFERFALAEKMVELQNLIEEARNWGVNPELVDPMVAEAEQIQQKLFAK